jgi:hypothetical protein
MAEPESAANKRVSNMVREKTGKGQIIEDDINTEIKRYQTMSKKEQIQLMNEDS